MANCVGVITRPKGFRSAAVACGLKSRAGTPDLGLLICDVSATVAGMFTTNRVCAAPVLVSGAVVKRGRARGVVVNAGNANACTGSRGLADARKMCELAASATGVKTTEMLVASTGIIGHRLDMVKVSAGIRSAALELEPGRDGASAFARAICTTDRWAKESLCEVKLGTETVTVAGVAKGAGMISPHMATMLAFMTTDARVSGTLLREMTRQACDKTFNCVTVDGDMSTNDTLLVLASGLSGKEVKRGTKEARTLAGALEKVMLTLAREMVRDGEGATKVMTVRVKGAATDVEADRAARRIANSSLVKCAMFGGDPNWGRIVAAAGSTRIRMQEKHTTLRIGGHVIYDKGRPRKAGPELIEHMRGKEIDVELSLGQGKGMAAMYGCDLTHDYVTLNAEYHT